MITEARLREIETNAQGQALVDPTDLREVVGELRRLRDVVRRGATLTRQVQTFLRMSVETRSDHSMPATYGADVALHFVGDCVKRRYSLLVDESRATLPCWLFEGLFKLAVAQRDSPGSYVLTQKLSGGGTSPDKMLSLLRKELEKQADLDPAFIERDNYGGVRLSLPPGRITFDQRALACDFSHLLHLL